MSTCEDFTLSLISKKTSNVKNCFKDDHEQQTYVEMTTGNAGMDLLTDRKLAVFIG